MKPNANLFYYFHFIQSRMEIYWNRLGGIDPLTFDPILAKHKFTNVYRILDRSSQFLVKEIINKSANDSDEDLLWRVILYKHYNLPSTWEYLEAQLGHITMKTASHEIVGALAAYNTTHPVYSNAYMLTCPLMKMPWFQDKYSLPRDAGKVEIYLRILEREFVVNGLMDRILAAVSFEDLFNVLRVMPGWGGFLSYQYAQDLNYTRLFNFDTNTFCSAGPGTERGIRRTFDVPPCSKGNGEVAVWVYQNFDKLCQEYSNIFNIDLTPKLLPNVPLSVPDLSNCFCETDKYMRGSGLTTAGVDGIRIKAMYQPSPNKIDYTFPEKWLIK